MPEIRTIEQTSRPDTASAQSAQNALEKITQPEQIAETPRSGEGSTIAPVLAPATGLSQTAVGSDSPSGDVLVLKKVEAILAENMESVFLSLDAVSQRNFKTRGEKTARKINQLLHGAKVRVGDIINLIISWLRLIPRVNRYYLEQEAKIKADAILRLYQNK